MKVTVTLSDVALEYVDGIPEEDLPEIISDLIDKFLKQSVRDVTVSENKVDVAYLKKVLKEIVEEGHMDSSLMSNPRIKQIDAINNVFSKSDDFEIEASTVPEFEELESIDEFESIFR